MALHFTQDEFETRRRRAVEAMQARGLDGLLLFKQESMYWLTGYDTFGYVYFQCLYLGADGRLMLLTRAPDLRQARHTSLVDDIRVWVDQEGHDPTHELREVLRGFGCAGKRLGAEWNAYGMTHALGKRLDAALDGFCETEDASDLISRLRLVKSAEEMEYVRRAAELADAALDAGTDEVRPGAFEGDILAAMHGAVYRGGGDDPANEFIIGSGQDALLCRYFSGRKHLGAEDQITLEFAGVYRHYHAALMRTIPVGRATSRHVEMHKVAVDAFQACRDACRPGRPMGEVFDAYARVCDAGGMRDHRMNATGYSLGTTYAPNWMDWPMFYTGNPVEMAPGMVFFLHMILMDSDTGTAMCPGATVVVTEDGNKLLSDRGMELVVR
ncbi:putative Xaa-Pro dipeptidase protein [Caenispirillum salinarum AK4]|uniref:Putative Xaa-Pro dipeptidase protein n=1 Tax=Caenispirillum salinarum AK4 TaxID=1238182 RepID=K9GLP1_9PROT|nr:Xaa-Pro peptidase family protein [Caenispirillum salinarum]EKV26930.1 putative Xaa-Pro dipeptidase protein [Caenispirillum salinarum AK4]